MLDQRTDMYNKNLTSKPLYVCVYVQESYKDLKDPYFKEWEL